MRLLNPNTSSETLQGCDRLWDDGEDVMVQLRPASAADHRAILPNYVPGRGDPRSGIQGSITRSGPQPRVSMSDVDVLGLYRGIVRRALRLETRQRYAVPWEKETLAAWRRGEPEPVTPEMEGTLGILRQVTASGRSIGRVRFVEMPLTEYSRHELEVAYPRLTEAGEDIRILDRALHPEFDRIRDDFVVFDHSSVMWYRYNANDVLTGYAYTEEPDVVRRCIAVAEEVRAAAVPYREFMARRR